MEHESLLTRLQEHGTCPCPKPCENSVISHSISWRPVWILSSHLHLGLPNGLFPPGLTFGRLMSTIVDVPRH